MPGAGAQKWLALFGVQKSTSDNGTFVREEAPIASSMLTTEFPET